MKPLSARTLSINPSPTSSLSNRLKQMRAAGQDVIDLCVGEPDFVMTEGARRAAIEAVRSGKNRYTEAAGTAVLRERISKKLADENGLSYDTDLIVVCAGTKHALFNTFLAICDDGDEVIVASPHWASYPEQLRLVGATPRLVRTDESTGFRMTADQLREHIGPRTKAVILNSPANPTGAAYTRTELAAIAAVVVEHDLYVVEDLIYEHYYYEEGTAPTILHAGAELAERTILINGLSKSCAMTGWRVGYTAAPAPITTLIKRIQDQSINNVTTVAQFTAIGALDDMPWELLRAFRARRDAAHRMLTAIDGITCTLPAGAFYLFPNVSALFGSRYRGAPIDSDMTFAAALLEATGVGLVPGSAFGSPANVRLSYALPAEDMQCAFTRIAEFVAELD